MDIQALSEKFGVNAEWGRGGDLPVFLSRAAGKTVLVITDGHTMSESGPIVSALNAHGSKTVFCHFEEEEPVADEKTAPRIMIGAGVGDILAKYCCLTDWRISHILTEEPYGEEAASLMEEAVRACDAAIPDLVRKSAYGVRKLMDALLISGYAMVIAGNSRPASGAEHRMSHFLEMDFLRRGERIPLHGVKVGLGTLVSLYLYHTLGSRRTGLPAEVYAEAEKLPSVEETEEKLASLGCPTKFSAIGVSETVVRRMFREAYKIRDRFTILTLYCTRGLMTEETVDELTGRFF